MRSISGKLLSRALPLGSCSSSQVGAVVLSAARGESRSSVGSSWVCRGRVPAGLPGLSSSSSAPPAQLLPAPSPRSPSPFPNDRERSLPADCLPACSQLGELVWVAARWVPELLCSSDIPGVIFSNFLTCTSFLSPSPSLLYL